MNDRYLYRAKHSHALSENEHLNGLWIVGYLSGEHHISNRDGEYLIDPYTICQCSGVYDKNKKTIFEKDIVNDEDGSIGIVEYGMYDHYHIGFFVRWLNKEADYYRNELGYWADKVECIGSAIDNPELFEVGE